MPNPPKHSSSSARALVALLLMTGLGLPQLGCSGAWPLLGSSRSLVQGGVVAPSTVSDVAPVIVYLESLDRRLAHARTQSPAVVRVGSGAFSPRVIAVAAGQPLEFAFEGDLLHQLFSYDEQSAFDLDTSGRERLVSVTLTRPGAVRFYCSLHPSESGVAFVVASPYFAVADPRGRWRIPGVAAGRYRLRTWSEGTRPTERGITVPAASVVEARDVLLTDVARATK